MAKPGLFREIDQEYRRRFEVVEFAVKHDDGQDPRGLQQADVILVGVSRTSKTPLSMFLAWRGLRVANVPVVHNLPLPEELAPADPRKVVGLTIKPERLLSCDERAYNRWRPCRNFHHATRGRSGQNWTTRAISATEPGGRWWM